MTIEFPAMKALALNAAARQHRQGHGLPQAVSSGCAQSSPPALCPFRKCTFRSVSNQPGQIPLTRIQCLAHSSARFDAIRLNAAQDALSGTPALLISALTGPTSLDLVKTTRSDAHLPLFPVPDKRYSRLHRLTAQLSIHLTGKTNAPLVALYGFFLIWAGATPSSCYG